MDPGAPKITLDQESFKALASDVRVEILKRLDARRETVTDLSNLMALSKPTLLEHLEKLQNAGLVKRVDEGRKWIYYALTDKGRKILHPERVAITLALSIGVVLAAVGMGFLLFASGGLLSEPRSLTGTDTWAPGELAPADGPPALIPFAVSAAFAAALFVVAYILHRSGTRRRARFFEELAAQ
jgi:DNA-binding transcriptional ArsR family regulator